MCVVQTVLLRLPRMVAVRTGERQSFLLLGSATATAVMPSAGMGRAVVTQHPQLCVGRVPIPRQALN